MEILVEEFGEGVAEEVAEAAVGVLIPGLGLVTAALALIKYGSKIKAIFFDKKPLMRVRAGVRQTVARQGQQAASDLGRQLEEGRAAVVRSLYEAVDAWQAQALRRGVPDGRRRTRARGS